MTLRNSLAAAFLAVAICFMLSASQAKSDDLTDAGKKIFDKWQNSVLIAQITTKSVASFEGHSPMTHEDKLEATTVIIDPSGLGVLCLSETSPEGMMSRMTSDDEDAPKVTSQITGINVLMPDGKQVPYKIVLRDKDLDLAFIRPETGVAQHFTAIDLTKSSKPALLENLIFLDRLSSIAARGLGAFPARVNAIVRKPRTFYVSGANGLGAPVFSLDGNIVGIVVLRSLPGAVISHGPSVMPIILPADDILDTAKQAPPTAQ